MSDRKLLLAQIRSQIADQRVLRAVGEVPRELFVPPELRARAWDNCALPIGADQTISQPTVVARMCELLELRGDETVLDVGTGSGYHAAILSRLAARVHSIERHPSLSHTAEQALSAAGIENVTLVIGDGTLGYPQAAPYDAICVAAAGREIPPALPSQLAEGGRLIIPVGPEGQRLALVRRQGSKLQRRDLDPVRFVPLISDQGE